MNLEQFKQLLEMLLREGLKDEHGYLHIMIMAQQSIGTKLDKLQNMVDKAIDDFASTITFGDDKVGNALSVMYNQKQEELKALHRDIPNVGPKYDLAEEKLKKLLHRLHSDLSKNITKGVDANERDTLAREFAEIGTDIDVRLERAVLYIETLKLLQDEVPKGESTSYTSAYLDLIR
jgi:hypothetical protein